MHLMIGRAIRSMSPSSVFAVWQRPTAFWPRRIASSSPLPRHPAHSALFAFSLSSGAVPSLSIFPFSMSAAHNAAPTVFVKANRMLATGTNSSSTAVTPKLYHVSRCSVQKHSSVIERTLYMPRCTAQHASPSGCYSTA